MFLLNNIIRIFVVLLFGKLLFSAQNISIHMLRFFRTNFGEITPITNDWMTTAIIFTIMSFVILDLFRFIQHYLMHKVPFLWKLHKLHHSAEVLTPITLNRIHPLEMILGMSRTILATAVSSSLFIYAFQVPLHGLDILGVNALGFMFNSLGANFRHSQLPISFGILEYIFISPLQHQLHHSKNHQHHNKNYGVCLSLWDHIFGSFLKSPKQTMQLEYGLQ